MRLKAVCFVVFAGACFNATAPTALATCPPRPNPASMVVKPEPDVEQAGKVLKRAVPTYPDCAEDKRVGGLVDMIFTVQQDGSVGDIQVVQEVPAGFGFASAGVQALSHWEFEPKLVEGKPVAFRSRLRLTWNLR
jgi:sensor domain CHASE-containing protein